ncbi:MAG: alpha/beta hydrolase [bacterium]
MSRTLVILIAALVAATSCGPACSRTFGPQRTPLVAATRSLRPHGRSVTVGYVRRGARPGRATVLVLGGPYCIEWFGLHLEPEYDVIYFDPAPESLLLSHRIADVEAVRAAVGAPRVFLFGHGDNGAVALEYAARYPRRVKGVVWVSGLSDLPKRISSAFDLMARAAPDAAEALRYRMLAAKKRFTVLELALSLQARKLFPRCHRSEGCRSGLVRAGTVVSRLDDYTRWLRSRPGRPPSMLEIVRSAAAPDLRNKPLLEYRTAEAAGRLRRTPVLMIQGGHDGIVPPAAARALARSLPRARLVLFEKSGHFPFLEENKRFVSEVRRFLGIKPGRPPVPSVLAPDWLPPYRTGADIPGALERRARSMAEHSTARRVDLMLWYVCRRLGAAQPVEVLRELGLTDGDRSAFHRAHCAPR